MAGYRKNGTGVSMSRKEPASLAELIPSMLKVMRLGSGMKEQLILSAWDKVTGAAPYTMSKYVRNGVLFCSISSSVVRSQLFFHRDEIVKAINRELETGPFADGAAAGKMVLKSLVLK